MKESLVLVGVGNPGEACVAGRRQRRRERAMDEAAALPRVWMEALERRVMMDAVAATTGFGADLTSTASFPGYAFARIREMAVAPGGKFYAVGEADGIPARDDPGQSPTYWAMARFNADGSPDPTFGTNGLGTEVFAPFGETTSWADSIVVQPDGRIIVGGGDIVARFNLDGTQDASFSGGIAGYISFNPQWMNYTKIWLTDSGKVVLAAMHWGDLGIERLNADGSRDSTFATNGYASATLVDSNAMLTGQQEPLYLLDAGPLPSGGIEAYAAGSGPLLMRAQFDSQGGVISVQEVKETIPIKNVTNVVVAPDGSAYVQGQTQSGYVIERLDASGAADMHFGSGGTGVLPIREPWADLFDGKFLVSSHVDDTTSRAVLVNADGSIDQTFHSGGPLDTWDGASPIFMLDGSIVAAGAGSSAPSIMQIIKFLPGDITTSGDGGGQNFATDPTVGFGSLKDSTGKVLTADDNGLFANPAGMSVWNPAGKRDVFDDGTGAL